MKRFVPAILLMTLALPGWHATPSQSVARAQTACTAASPHGNLQPSRLVTAENSFGFSLYRYLYAHRSSPNVFISPASIALDLDMAFAGARGTTRSAMATALGLAGIRQPAVANMAGSFLNALHSHDPKVQLQIANSLWVDDRAAIKQHFLTSARYHFGAQVSNLDLNSNTAPRQINAWVSCATHQTIKQILNSTAGMLSVLVNTIYFHGQWPIPFNPRSTRPATFTTNKGARIRLPFMFQQNALAYYHGANFQAVNLPFGSNRFAGRFSMLIVLPQSGLSLSRFAAGISPATWQAWTAHMHSGLVNLLLPRFTTQGDYSLKKSLTALGMGAAFGAAANLNGICAGCRISDVIHKTYLLVNEKGTIASAATAVILAGGGQPQHIEVINVNHPFLLAIRDNRTRAILFLGGINRPTAAQAAPAGQ